MVIVPITKGPGEDTDLVNKAIDGVVQQLKAAGVRVKASEITIRTEGGAGGAKYENRRGWCDREREDPPPRLATPLTPRTPLSWIAHLSR